MMAASLVGVAFMSCSSQDDVLTPAGQTYTMSVTAQKGGDGTRALNLDGNTLNATWTEGDVVKVYNSASTELGELTAQTAGKSTILSGSLTKLPENDETLTLKYLSPSYSAQDGTLTGADNSIDKVCDYATATVTATVSGTNVTTGAATFQNQQTIVKFTLVDKADGTTKLTPTAFTMTDGTSTVELTNIPAGTYTTNGGDGVLYVAFPASNVSADITLTATVGSDTYTCTTSEPQTLGNGKYYGVTAKMAKQATVPDGALNGVFSVSDTKKVYFSKGNLRYASGTWSFFDNQYDYYSSYSADAWDKFGWGTGDNPTKTSTNNADYGTFNDWGNNSDLQTSLGTGWFTLSSAEWTYLFNTRSANRRYAKAKVNNVKGVILFPDTYTHPGSVTAPHYFDNPDVTFDYNNYSSADWTKMEAAGAVFLPAAGWRDGSTVDWTGTSGSYWSATPSDTEKAYGVAFNSNILYPANGYDRNRGYSVRLVKDVAAPAPAVPTGALSGKFSVSATKKVKFSQGNLRYASGTWSFFDNQYDYYTSYSADAWDNFGWSASTTPYGMDTSTSNSLYSGDFVDWGATMGTGWFTLSSAEWTYLFNTRTTATTNMPTGTNSSAARYTRATVAGVSGVILFPDNYAHPAGVTVTISNAAYNTGNKDYTTFTVDASNWVTMESAGCVFLPAAGYREGSSPRISPGTCGLYWSSTANGTEAAYSVFFWNDVNPAYTISRYYGFCVRLVRDAN